MLRSPPSLSTQEHDEEQEQPFPASRRQKVCSLFKTLDRSQKIVIVDLGLKKDLHTHPISLASYIASKRG